MKVLRGLVDLGVMGLYVLNALWNRLRGVDTP